VGLTGVKPMGFGMSKELPFLPTTTRALPFFTLKSILRQKEELWKSSLEENQNPSKYYYNSITIFLKFQHKPKYYLPKILI
jgi:hypothetical protein